MSKSMLNPRTWVNKAYGKLSVKFRRGTSRGSKKNNKQPDKPDKTEITAKEEEMRIITAIAKEEEENGGYVIGVGGATSPKNYNK